MTDNSSSIRRHLLGLIALIMMAGGLTAWFFPGSDASLVFGQAAVLKVGIVLGLTWLAFPQLQRLPAWLGIAIFILGLALAVRPRVVMALARASVFLIPVLPVVWLLWPRSGRRGREITGQMRKSDQAPVESPRR